MTQSRRSFLHRAASAGLGAVVAPSLLPLVRWNGIDAAGASALRSRNNGGLGPLVQSKDCPELWIPENFRVVKVSVSRAASPANPSFMVPSGFDGMASFALPNGDIRLIRNHELTNPAARAAPLGARPYDNLASGGTSSLTVRVVGNGSSREVQLVEEFVSIGGTHTNCAGGRTPWGSWLTCEETTVGASQGYGKPHGYIFEVPVSAKEAVEAIPLKAMGRFVHEAVAVDPRTSHVFETEDMRWSATDAAMPGAGFYRFVPRTPQRLGDGGRLQILGVRDRPRYNTVTGQSVGVRLPVRWIDLEAPDSPAAEQEPSTVLREGLSKGGAIFDRLEGCFWGDNSVYFTATSGGNARAGQVWRYVPGASDDGYVTLVFESTSRDVLDSPDNICVTSRGGVIICEDSSGEEFVRGLSRTGEMMNLVQQPVVQGQPSPLEFAGSCFSPDEQVLFFNIQGARTSYGPQAGSTYAMWGPWEAATGL